MAIYQPRFLKIDGLRGKLCSAQAASLDWPAEVHRKLSDLIREIDRHQPLDSAGRHEYLHKEN